jgi:peptidoglycan/LPS O-acetylase OafA/YrhL
VPVELNMVYKPALDGLRALAVVLVLLFHAKLPLFSGGFVGVDVFFVISGYLITTLIVLEQQRGRFTIASFYERRARRILPAFFLVALATLGIATLVLLPPVLKDIGPSAIAATIFASNFYFWKFTGQNYLLDETKVEPFLHTWSLAIEEQFYLGFPLFMVVAHRYARRSLGPMLLTATIGSFAYSVYLVARHPEAAFYFPLSRAWELLLGGWIAVAGVGRLATARTVLVLQSAGLVMILVAAMTYDNLTAFPGLAALLPCVGTALVATWSERDSWVVRVLSVRAIVWFGLISYPLYLWHWPLLTLAKLALLRELRPAEIVIIYGVALLLAAATWRWVESLFRGRNSVFTTTQVTAMASVMACVVIGTGVLVRARGSSFAAPPNVERVLAAAKDYAPLLGACHNWDRRRAEDVDRCVIGDITQPAFDFVLWGDSHAGADAVAVDAAAKRAAKKGIQLTADNCPPLLDTEVLVRRGHNDCEARNERGLELIAKHHISRVILAGQWIQYVLGRPDIALRRHDSLPWAIDDVTAFREALNQTVDRLRRQHIEVMIVGPVPEMAWNVPQALAAAEWRHAAWPTGPAKAEFLSQQLSVMAVLHHLERTGVPLVYPHEFLCAETCTYARNGNVFYSDSEHLSTRGADLLRPSFEAWLSGSAKTKATPTE